MLKILIIKQIDIGDTYFLVIYFFMIHECNKKLYAKKERVFLT